MVVIRSLVLIFLFVSCGGVGKNGKVSSCSVKVRSSLTQCLPMSCKEDLNESVGHFLKTDISIENSFKIAQEKDHCLYEIYNEIGGKSTCRIPRSDLSNYSKTRSLTPSEGLNYLYMQKSLFEAEDKKDFYERYDALMKGSSLGKMRKNLEEIKNKDKSFEERSKKYCSLASEGINQAKKKEFTIALENFQKKGSQSEKFSKIMREVKKDIEVDTEEQAYRLKELCDQGGDGKICYQFSRYAKDRQSLYEAALYAEKACQKKYRMGCGDASYHYSLLKNYGPSKKNAENGCSLGDAVSCYNLACHHCRMKEKKDALSAFKSAVDSGWNRVKDTEADNEIECIRKTKLYKDFLSLKSIKNM